MKIYTYPKHIRWYRPFQLIKRNKELERINSELCRIINNYSDELKDLKKQIKNFEKE